MNEGSAFEKTFHNYLIEGAMALGTTNLGDDLVIDNILAGQTYYRKSSFNTPLADLSYYLTILDSGSYGFAYYNGSPKHGNDILDMINKNAVDVIAENSSLDFPLKISILDALYGVINQRELRQPERSFFIDGTYQKKADFRSRLVTNSFEKGKRVLLVGLVTEFVRDLLAKDVEVSVSDMSPELSDSEVHGVEIINGGNELTLGQLAISDIAIVTGATISNNTIDSIFNTARENNTELHFYLETGSNFAPQLIDRGAASVVAEKFPFYDMPGQTTFEVYGK